MSVQTFSAMGTGFDELRPAVGRRLAPWAKLEIPRRYRPLPGIAVWFTCIALMHGTLAVLHHTTALSNAGSQVCRKQ
jgi:hypothetical protein